jgi:ABC-type Zn uptake system ZnuABC Zn-binding protein ZnuA
MRPSFPSRIRTAILPLALTVLWVIVQGCSASNPTSLPSGSPDQLAAVSLEQGEKLQVVATTSIVADVVSNIGGAWIDLHTLIPPDTDPHAFEPTPRDASAISDADIVFANGAGLETFLDKLLANTGAEVIVIPVSQGVDLLSVQDQHEHDEHQGDEHESEEGVDPHTWFDPNNVIVWVDNIEQTLAQLDPSHADQYAQAAAAYRNELNELDQWIREQLEPIPESGRKLVTDHTVFGYLARQYGFEQVGAVFPGYNTLAEPSAQELAQLERAIEAANVRTIFVGRSVSSDLAQRIADDAGIEVVRLYTGSLGAPSEQADTYLELMRYNVRAITDALR